MTTIAASYCDVVLGERPGGFLAVAFGQDGYWDADKYKHPTGKWTERRYRWPVGREALDTDITRMALAGDRVDVYACPALRSTDDRRKGSALPPRACWADLDGSAADGELLATLDPYTVKSGSDDHRHLYVPLTREVDLVTHARLNKALAVRLGADHKWSDESLLRLPGTRNHKVDPPTVVTPLPWSGRRWDPEALAALLGVDLSAAAGAPTSPNGHVPITPEAAPDPLPALVRDALEHPDIEDRSAAHHRLVGACHDAGLTQGQTLTVAQTYGPSRIKYNGRLAAEVDRSWSSVAAGAPDQGSSDPAPGASYQPIDLGPYLRGEVRKATPSVGVYRRDGLQLLYPGKAHVVFGEMESGKSWLALMSVAVELDAGHHVAYLHFEESDPSDTVERLQALQVPDHAIESRFHFAGPTEVCKSRSYLFGLAKHRPTLAVLDGVNEAMGLNGMDIYAPDGATAFRARFIRPFTSCGAAVLAGDHVVKDSSARGRSPMGSVHKGNGIDGSLILLENADPFGRGMRGRSHVFVTKDRPGYLRQRGRPVPKEPAKSFMGELVIDDTRTSAPMLDAVLFTPKPADSADDAADDGQVDAVLREQVEQAVARRPGGVESARKLIAACRVASVKASDKRIIAAADYLEAAGRFELVHGPRNAEGFRVAPATAAKDRQ